MLTEKIDRVHGLFVWNRPKLHHREELVEVGLLLEALELLDDGVRAAADAHAIFDQGIDSHLAWIESLILFWQIG